MFNSYIKLVFYFLGFVLLHVNQHAWGQNNTFSLDTLSHKFFITADEKHRCVCGDAAKLQACDTCFDAAHPILKTAFDMGCRQKEIIKGSCWTFANEVFHRTVGPEGKTKIYLKSKGGPYASASLIEPGDWIYHINYSYRGVDHSALFICWTDVERRKGLTLSYYGQNRKTPARIEEFDLRSVFGIFRAQTGHDAPPLMNPQMP